MLSFFKLKMTQMTFLKQMLSVGKSVCGKFEA